MKDVSYPDGSYRIFISYAREDSLDIALRLRDDLASAGHDVWLDLAEIAVGASWSRDIESAIENSDILLALLSPGSYVSDICRAEQLRALRKQKRVIPLLTQPDADRPIHLENLNYIDFSNLAFYDNLLADLLSFIESGALSARMHTQSANSGSQMPIPRRVTVLPDGQLKRDARAFRRYIADLRDETWLGENAWWTSFAFYFADIQRVAKILNGKRIRSPYNRARPRQRWERSVRLNFRPRTPDLFGAEGIRPASLQTPRHVGAPVYLLFDLEALLTMPLTRFSEGDVFQTRKTFKAASAFRDLPFDLIYHDGPFSKEERDEIVSARKAQIILPESKSLNLDQLQYIWCRSTAEYETLAHLLSDEAWRKWGGQITARSDYDLFNRQWAYVKSADLTEAGVHFDINPPAGDNPYPIYSIHARIETEDGSQQAIEFDDLELSESFALDFSELNIQTPYSIELLLDNALAYAGRFVERPQA